MRHWMTNRMNTISQNRCTRINRGASFRWSFCPLSERRIIESTIILTTHPSLFNEKMIVFQNIPLTFMHLNHPRTLRTDSIMLARKCISFMTHYISLITLLTRQVVADNLFSTFIAANVKIGSDKSVQTSLFLLLSSV